MKYFLLGGSGRIGKALSIFFNNTKISYEVVDRSHKISSLVSDDYDVSIFMDNDFSQDILIYMLPGNRDENIAQINNFCKNIKPLDFKKVIFLSSFSSSKANNIQSLEKLDSSNDPYGKRYCEIRLSNSLENIHILILRLGMVVESNTRWDNFINTMIVNKLTLPPYQKYLPVVSATKIFQEIVKDSDENLILLPETPKPISALGLKNSKFTVTSIAKFTLFLSHNLTINSLKLIKFIFFNCKYE